MITSLSDLLTPWEKIERRLAAAAEGDFAIAIYNPASRKRKDYLKKACDILLRYIEGGRACGYVENLYLFPTHSPLMYFYQRMLL